MAEQITENASNPLEFMGKDAREAARHMASLSSAQKNELLLALADALDKSAGSILQANSQDIEAARAAGMSESLLDRLALESKSLVGISRGVRGVWGLPDPVGGVLD